MRASLAGVLLLLPSLARASSLDVSTYYRLRALSYSNLTYDAPRNDHSFMTQKASLNVGVKNVPLASSDETRLDVWIKLSALGVAGSSTALQAPFDRIAAHYPDTAFTPFIENAYAKAHNLFGWPWEVSVGQQPYQLGSGLLLADDGAGLTGFSAAGKLPWWGMRTGGFIFQPRNSQRDPNSLMVYGATLELPVEGLWQLHAMVEKDKNPQTAGGAVGANDIPFELPVNNATRYFSSLRYQITFGPLSFDGEAALQRGSAVSPGPSALNPGGEKVNYEGDAQVLKAKWRQTFWKGGEGIARLVVARASGDSQGSLTTDEAFFPSHGRRYDGLERAGFGDFLGATPYDVFTGSDTKSGLPRGVSGVQTFGMGFTPPAYRGVAMDFDYFIFQADRNIGPHRTLGNEIDLRLRYRFRDALTASASAALFTAGRAMSVGKGSARRYMFEVTANF